MSLTAQDAKKFAQVVTFTNITTEEFIHTHAFGDMPAMPYRFEPGERRVLPFVIANHLAKHLARKILIGKAQTVDPRVRKNLWGKEDEEALKRQILSDMIDAPAPHVKTRAEEVQEHIDRLNPEDREIVDPDETNEVLSKQEIIAALKEKGGRPDVRKTKAELKSELKEFASHSEE